MTLGRRIELYLSFRQCFDARRAAWRQAWAWTGR